MAPPAQSNGHSGTNGHANGHSNGNASAAPMSDSKLGNGWLPPTNRTNHPEITTNSGMGYANPSHSLSLGPRGPVLLEDFHTQEKLAQFNRERIPERVVHARGMGAKGYFEVTHDVTDQCDSDFLSEVGKRTPVATRFSTVVHERGSPESLRDVRGFSVKFYTQQGNWDFVGNNIPVFFERDGAVFVEQNKCLKPNPVTGIQEGWRVLDFLSHHPESTHVLTWLLDLTGIPQNWRVLEGHSVNTFVLNNKQGQQKLVKFHFLPKGGAKFMTDEEAQAVGSENMRHSHATFDLVENIRKGNFPEWDFMWQTMDPAEQENFDFDPLDCTKIWPEDKFPLQMVGKMVLDETAGNIFNEVEQIAFSPSMLVPGIGASDDKLLQSRLFAYADAQRYRLGINYLQLPINQPKNHYHNNHNDGAVQFNDKNEEVNYWPSKVEHTDEIAAKTYPPVDKQEYHGKKVRQDIPKALEDPLYDFRQAGDRWRNIISKDNDRKELFLTHVVTWLSMPKCNEKIRNTWLNYWGKVDAGLGAEVTTRLKKALSSQ